MQLYDLPTHNQSIKRLVSQGADGLNEIELLSIVLRSNEGAEKSMKYAKQLLKGETLSQLLSLSVSELATLPGFTLATASLLVAMRSLCQLAGLHNQSTSITHPSQVATMMTYLTTYAQEHVVVLYLNARNRLLEQKTISIGTVNSALIHPREVFAPALACRACSIIVVHNHPSGDCEPSPEDIKVTKQLNEVGGVLDVALIDHVIVSKEGWRSLKQETLM